jgi:hypothetical protein
VRERRRGPFEQVVQQRIEETRVEQGASAGTGG